MTAPQSTLQAGVVVRLDTDALRAHGGCLTNAVIGPQGDRAVTGTHDFLVLYVDATTSMCTAVPLFHKSAVGNQPLVDALKSGPPVAWIGMEVFFSHWQHWRIPSALVHEAMEHDGLTAETRRSYAVGNPSALDDVRMWESHNRASYRPA
jgi:hypothetical protein